jgi:hypothetical protein
MRTILPLFGTGDYARVQGARAVKKAGKKARDGASALRSASP